MKKLILCTALLAGAAHAEFWDGNKLFQSINGSIGEQMMAMGYVTGVADAYRSREFCPSPNVTIGQITDVVKLYLERNPAMRHFTADAVTAVALSAVWPCVNNRNRSNL
jgi:hypothetical protein